MNPQEAEARACAVDSLLLLFQSIPTPRDNNINEKFEYNLSSDISNKNFNDSRKKFKNVKVPKSEYLIQVPDQSYHLSGGHLISFIDNYVTNIDKEIKNISLQNCIKIKKNDLMYNCLNVFIGESFTDICLGKDILHGHLTDRVEFEKNGAQREDLNENDIYIRAGQFAAFVKKYLYEEKRIVEKKFTEANTYSKSLKLGFRLNPSQTEKRAIYYIKFIESFQYLVSVLKGCSSDTFTDTESPQSVTRTICTSPTNSNSTDESDDGLPITSTTNITSPTSEMISLSSFSNPQSRFRQTSPNSMKQQQISNEMDLFNNFKAVTMAANNHLHQVFQFPPLIPKQIQTNIQHAPKQMPIPSQLQTNLIANAMKHQQQQQHQQSMLPKFRLGNFNPLMTNFSNQTISNHVPKQLSYQQQLQHIKAQQMNNLHGNFLPSFGFYSGMNNNQMTGGPSGNMQGYCGNNVGMMPTGGMMPLGLQSPAKRFKFN